MICTALVFFMHLGFSFLEIGLTRQKNTINILFKNFFVITVGLLIYCLGGFNLMYPGFEDGEMGIFKFAGFGIAAPEGGMGFGYADGGYTWWTDFLFQGMFAATAATIVSGAVAERIKLNAFMLFSILYVGLVYPIVGSWKWGGGFLDAWGFYDFAGSTLVHSVGGWGALITIYLLGARIGKFDSDGKPKALPGHNLPIAAAGVFILWLGWFGFNGASQLALGSYADADAVATIFANTSMAAAGGVLAPMVLSRLMYGKTDIGATLNGAIAGLVSITAEPLTPSIGQAIIIGGIGGIICMFGMKLLDKLKIDDVVGAIPAHLFAGIWGTLIVPFTNGDTSYGTQIIGILAFGIFTVIGSTIVWFILKSTVGIRASDDDEEYGLDYTESGQVGLEYVSKKK
jgi:Amt family ammonium transporter